MRKTSPFTLYLRRLDLIALAYSIISALLMMGGVIAMLSLFPTRTAAAPTAKAAYATPVHHHSIEMSGVDIADGEAGYMASASA